MAKQKIPETVSMRAGSTEQTINQTIVVPPDGGWGWVIVGVGFLGGVLLDAVPLSFPYIDRNLVYSLNFSPVSVSLILSLFNCLMQLLGPVAGALTNRFGFRSLMFAGSFLFGVGFGLCFIIHNYELMILCFSVVTGVGGSLIYMVLMTCPGYWFEEKRSIAFGVASASSGVTFSVVPIISYEVEKAYGWRYVFFVLAVLGLLGWLSSFLLKKPPVALVRATGVDISDIKTESDFKTMMRKSMTMSLATVGPPTLFNKKIRRISTQTGIQFHPGYFPRTSAAEIYRPKGFKKIWFKITGKYNEKCIDRPLYKKDIFYQSKTSMIAKKYNLHPDEYTLSVQKLATLKDVSQQLEGACTCCPEAITRPMKEMLDVSVLKNTPFMFLAIGTFLYFFCCYIPYVYITKSCQVKEIPEATGILATALFGIGISVARICYGLVFIVFPKMLPTYFASGMMITGGLFMLGVGLVHDDVAIVILATAAGIFYGPWFPLRSVLLVEYLGLEKLTSAVGILFVFQAMGSLIGNPVAEFLIGFFDEINVVFYLTGIVWIVIGTLIAPLDLFRPKTQDKLEDSAFYQK